MRTARSRRAARGTTLVELIIGSVALVAVMVPVGLLLTGGVNSFRTTSGSDAADSIARQALDRIARELGPCVATSLGSMPQSPWWSSTVTLDQVTAVAAADATRTTQRLDVRFEYELSDPDDGIDNDRDGLVDEGQVVMTHGFGSPGARRTVVARNVAERLERETANAADDNGNALVDERGFCLERVGNSLTLRLTIQSRTPAGLVLRTAEDTVFLRN
jgi:hypothetical protein